MKKLRRWLKQHPAWCWLFKWHWLRFVRKEDDGRRLLRCSRCGFERYTKPRLKVVA